MKQALIDAAIRTICLYVIGTIIGGRFGWDVGLSLILSIYLLIPEKKYHENN